jgi:hypothetical protein
VRWHGLTRGAFFGAALACLTIGQRATAQHAGSQADAALLRCSATFARLSAPLTIPNGAPTRPGQPEDTAQARVWEERYKEHTDSAVAATRGCLSQVDFARVSDSLLDTLFEMQSRVHAADASRATLERILRAPFPMEDRANDLLSKSVYLESNANTTAFIRAHLPLIDSLRDTRTSLAVRLDLAQRVRHAEPRAAYLELQHALDYLASLSPVERNKVVRLAGEMIPTLAQWGTQDSTGIEAMGLSFKLLALYPDHETLVQYPIQMANRITRVGAPALPLTSPHWLNMPAGLTQIPVADGKVTLVELTTLECSACKFSYQPLQQMANEYGPKGLNIVFAVPPGDSTTVAEYKAMFAHFQVTLPVMLDERTPTYMRSYASNGVPQFILIDRQGIVRDIPLGWFNEGANLKQTILQLLAEQQ